MTSDQPAPPSGDDLVRICATLSNPHRLRVLAVLACGGRKYVSQLARELAIGRPLLHMHLQRLEAAGLVVSSLEVSPDGKAMKFFEVAPFEFHLTPASIAVANISLTEAAFAADGRGKARKARRGNDE